MISPKLNEVEKNSRTPNLDEPGVFLMKKMILRIWAAKKTKPLWHEPWVILICFKKRGSLYTSKNEIISILKSSVISSPISNNQPGWNEHYSFEKIPKSPHGYFIDCQYWYHLEIFSATKPANSSLGQVFPPKKKNTHTSKTKQAQNSRLSKSEKNGCFIFV